MNEPNLSEIDDFSNLESRNKHNFVLFIVGTLLITSGALTILKVNYEHLTPDLFNPVIIKDIK
jgi:hypothetical protein